MKKEKVIKHLMRFSGARPAVAGIIKNGNKILLTKRSKTITEGGKWCIPGGRLEKWEKAEKTLGREIKEELGLKVVRSKFLFYHDEFVKRINLHSVVLVFLANVRGKEKFNFEVSETGWFTKEEALKLDLAFEHKEILRRFFKSPVGRK